MSNKTNVSKAFTLIELLIVVAIIAILAAIAVPNFLEAQTRAKVSRVKSDMRSLSTAMESYKIDTNKYSPVFNNLDSSFTPPWQTLVTGKEQRIDRIKWLTTPIQYLSNAYLFDTFAPTKQADTDLIVIWGWPAFMDPQGSLKGYKSYFKEQKNILSALNDPKNLWIAFSMGPDKDYDVNDFDHRDVVGIQTYDPTNGTISDGDILRASVGEI